MSSCVESSQLSVACSLRTWSPSNGECETVGLGASVSFTWTLKVQTTCPVKFDATQLTTFVPFGKWYGELMGFPFKVQVTRGAGRPDASGEKLTSAVHAPVSLDTVRSEGQVVKDG